MAGLFLSDVRLAMQQKPRIRAGQASSRKFRKDTWLPLASELEVGVCVAVALLPRVIVRRVDMHPRIPALTSLGLWGLLGHSGRDEKSA
jgi:hypothetical protein